MGRYQLVDFAARYQKGFRNHVVPLTDVPAQLEKCQYFGCYSTYFIFADELLTYLGARTAAAPSVSGYEGKVWAPYLPIDLDHPDLLPALECARLLSGLLLERWRIDPHGLQIYFSGAKGFHLMLDSRLFGKTAPARHIELSGEELGSVVRSAYLHRFPYRYSCRDALLRRYCPLKDENDCQAFVAGKSLTPPQRKSGR